MKRALIRRGRGTFINGGFYLKEKGHLLKKERGTCENIRFAYPS